MKKILAIVTVLALMATFCLSSFAVTNLDSMTINTDQWPSNPAEAGKLKVRIDPGDKLYILGWAYSLESTLERIVWYADGGEENECADVYRDRPDVAGAFGLDEEVGIHAGIGYNDQMMEVIGIDALTSGEYEIELAAIFADGTEETLKEFTLIVGDGTPVVVTKNNLPKNLEVELYVELTTDGVEVDELDDGSISCYTESGTDPWISIPLDEIDASIYSSFTVKYTVDGVMHGNNIYLRDDEVCPGYSPNVGTWAQPFMDGFEEKTFDIPTSFSLFEEATLTGIRFPGAAEGGTLVIHSITFHNPNGVEIRSFDSDLGDALSYDQILVNGESYAEGNDAVIEKKKSVDGTAGNINTIGFYGWYGNANSETEAFGYSIDGAAVVYGDFFFETDSAVSGLNANNRRFKINVDVSGLKDDGHEIWVWAKLANGDEVKLDRFDNRGQDGEKDREIYVVYNAPATPTEAPATATPEAATSEPEATAEPETTAEPAATEKPASSKKGCGGVIGGGIALCAAAACILVLKKKH